MKKTFSLLAATVFTIQTLLPNTLIAQAAEPQTSMTPADITAALQSLEIAGLDDILDQIADYQGAFDLADFDLSQIPELAELIQQFTDSIPDDLAPALGNIDVNSLISQLFGSDLGEQAQQYLQNALTQIVNDTIARAKEVKLDELRSRVEQYIKTIAPDVISGTYTKEDAKLKITGAINTLIAEIEKEIFEYIYDTIVNEANLQTVYDEAYRLAYDDTAYQAAYDAVVASFDYDATYKTWLATLTQGTADCSILWDENEKAECETQNQAIINGNSDLTTAQSALNVAQEALNTASDAKTLTEKNLIDGVNTLISKQENIVAPLKTAYEDAQSALEICDANIKEKNIALNVLDKAKSDALSDSDYIAADTLVSQRKEAYDKKVEENQTALQDKQTALATTSGNLAAANTELAKYDEGIIMRSESKINKQTCNWVFTCYDWTITYTIEGGGEYWKAKVSAEGLTFNSTKQITAPDISKTIYYLYLQQEIENGDAADRIKTAYNVAKSTVENAIASLFDTTYTSAKIDAQSAKDTAQTNYGDALSAYNAAAQATASDEYNAWQNASTDKDTLYKNFIKDAQAAYDAEPGCNDRETKYNVVYGYSIEGIGHIPGTKKTYEWANDILKGLQDSLNPESNAYVLKTLADTYQKAIDDAQSALNARQTELDTIEDDFANAQLSAEEKAEKIASYLQGVTIDTAKGAGEFADITPRKVAELAGTAAQEALKASATLAANAVVSAFDTVARPIAEGVHTFAGKVVDEIFGVIDQARDFAQDTALPALETAAQALQDQITQIADEITKLETKAKSFSDDIDNLLSSLKTHSDLNFLQDYVTALQKRKALVDTTLATLKTAYTPLQNNLQDIKTKLEKIENDERTLQQDEAFTIKNLKIWIEDIIALFNLIGTQAGAVQEILKDIAEVASNLDTLNKSFVTEVTDEIEKLTDRAKQAINQAIKEGLTNVDASIKAAETTINTIVDASIKAAETTINTIVDEIIARLPALKTALKGAVDTALKNLTEYAKDEIEKALTEALKQLKDRLDTIAKNIIGEIEEAVSKDIDKLHQTLEWVRKQLENAVETAKKEFPILKDKIDELLRTSQAKIEEAFKKKLDELNGKVQEAFQGMYKDAIQYLQDNSLAAPIFTGSETAPYCTGSQRFITTGNAIELPMMEYEAESEEVWGYVAFFTDAEGDTQLYVLPGQKVQAFPITTLTKDTDYKLEIRTIGKNQILPVSTAEIYNFILGLELTKGRADLQHQITGEFAALQAKLADVQEPSYVQEVLEGFDLIASLVAGKIAIPAELQKRIIAELTDLQNKLKALPTHIAWVLTTVESFRDETLGDHLGKWTNIEEEQLPYSLTIEKIYTFFDETLKDVANPSETYRITSVEAPTVSLTPVVITLANGETSTGVEIALPASENIRYLSGNQVITAITGTFGVGIYTGEIVVEKIVDCLTLTSALAERSITINEEVKNDNNSGGGSSSSGWWGGGSYYGGSSSVSTPSTLSSEAVLSGEVVTFIPSGKCSIENSIYSEEENAAYLYACEKDITTIKTIQAARMHDQLTRAEMAKIVSQYLITQIPERTPNLEKDCSAFNASIAHYQGTDLYDYMTLACQYEVMGIHPDYTPLTDFMPDKYVSRAEFGTIFSRILRGKTNEGSNQFRYQNHLLALRNAKIISNIDPTLLELRAWVFLQLYRAATMEIEE